MLGMLCTPHMDQQQQGASFEDEGRESITGALSVSLVPPIANVW